MMFVICNRWIDEAKGWRCARIEGHDGRCAIAEPGESFQTTGTTSQGDSFTFEKLKAAMDLAATIPPAPFFASSRMFPDNGAAIRFKRGGRDFCGAHPRFWDSVAAQMPAASDAMRLIDTPIIDLDLSANAALKDEFMANLTLALDEQP